MKYHTETLPNGLSFRLAHIPGGEFRMGSDDGDKEAEKYEKPAHLVRLNDFYLGEFAVTQDLWEAVTGENPSGFKGTRRPVEKVSWDDIIKLFLPKLVKMTGREYRLPSEAEWEYAARGGPYWETEGYRYAGSDLLEQVGWYEENSDYETHEVGLLLSNALGLYDLSGNVWEWCEDWYGEYSPELQTDPKGAVKGVIRVLRGGGYFVNARSCRAASRSLHGPEFRGGDFGFRLALSLQGGG